MRRIAVRLALTALAAATVAVVVVPAEIARAAGPPCQRTFSSGAINLPIGAAISVAESTINVPEDGLVVADVDVLVNLVYSFVHELKLDLFSESDAGTSRGWSTLFANSASGANLLGTVFDDSASTPISAGVAPFAGRFIPEMPLTRVGGSAGGTWRLIVSRNGSLPGSGTLEDWSVTVRYASCDFDHDGVEDHHDSCLSQAGATVSGCPLPSRSVTAKYAKGKFKGVLSSSAAACRSNRSVTVWKVRSGPDRKVGTATTRSDGFYKLARSRHRGKYYATSPRLVVTGIAECKAAASATFRVR
jgi:subtilisin-like proprotein convertase family protein